MTFNAAKVMDLIAVICFVLGAFSVHITTVNIVDIGLAFLAASFIV